MTVNVYEDTKLVLTFKISDSLIKKTAISGIGIEGIGDAVIGSSSDDVSVIVPYEFELEKLLPKRKSTGRITVEFTWSGQGQILEITTIELSGVTAQKFDRKIRQ